MDKIKKDRLIKFVKFLLIKFPVFLGILLFLIIISLKMVERYPIPLKEGFEQYLSKAYNANVTIGKLDKISFFPDIDVRVTDVTMHDNANAGIIYLDAQSIVIRAPFWNMLFHNGYLKALEINALKAKSGFILPKDFVINTLNIVDREGPEKYGSFIVAEGFYNKKTMVFEAEINKVKEGYKIKNSIPFSLKISKAELNGEIKKNLRSVELYNTVLTLGNEASESKNYILYQDKEFNEDNPFYCILNSNEIDECNKYIRK